MLWTTEVAAGSVPMFLTTGAAAIISGLGFATFKKRYLDTGLVATEKLYGHGSRQVVITSSFEHEVLHRSLTLHELVEAERRLEPGRRRQGEYRQRGRGPKTAREVVSGWLSENDGRRP